MWSPELGFGVIDVAAAVASATGAPATPRVALAGTREGRTLRLAWSSGGAASYRLSVSEDGGPARLLLDRTAATSLDYDLTVGRSYSFTVMAMDAAGATVAASDPYAVTLRRGTATLSMSASRSAAATSWTSSSRRACGRAPASPRRAARSSSKSWTGRRWQEVDRRATDDGGQVAWRVQVETGAYRVRARLLGDAELGAVTAAPVRVRCASRSMHSMRAPRLRRRSSIRS